MSFYLLFEANTYRLDFIDHIQGFKRHKGMENKTRSKVAGRCYKRNR